jgi:hypothetical protein
VKWLLPTIADVPAGGQVRNVGRYDRRAYDRAYYHAKRKGRRQAKPYTPAQLERRRKQRMAGYYRNADRERANARATRYWKNRERYAAAARERQRKLRSLLSPQ